jgi:hypothetical protein
MCVYRYEDGYTEDSQAILWFWEVVHELKTAEQKKLLQFITGSDRVGDSVVLCSVTHLHIACTHACYPLTHSHPSRA